MPRRRRIIQHGWKVAFLFMHSSMIPVIFTTAWHCCLLFSLWFTTSRIATEDLYPFPSYKTNSSITCFPPYPQELKTYCKSTCDWYLIVISTCTKQPASKLNILKKPVEEKRMWKPWPAMKKLFYSCLVVVYTLGIKTQGCVRCWKSRSFLLAYLVKTPDRLTRVGLAPLFL